MPRVARHVFPNLPHHITECGNRREDGFFNDDKQFYLELLIDYCKKHHVIIAAYCLMDNHIHLILVPKTEDGLQKVLKPLHMRYAQYINKQHGWTGHLWQGRFFSSALDDAHTYSAIRYVERNPVEAGMVEKAEDYKWSSAGFYCGLAESKAVTNILERYVEKGLPCGSDSFIEKLEQKANSILRYRPRGRPNIKG